MLLYYKLLFVNTYKVVYCSYTSQAKSGIWRESTSGRTMHTRLAGNPEGTKFLFSFLHPFTRLVYKLSVEACSTLLLTRESSHYACDDIFVHIVFLLPKFTINVYSLSLLLHEFILLLNSTTGY